MSARKAPQKTAQRILDASLALFNRFGEPNTATAMIASDLGISSGNLYYHYPSKDTLVNTLFEDFEDGATALLEAASEIQNAEDIWFFLHSLFELIWQYRFLYRDLNHLLSRNRTLELRFPPLLLRTHEAFMTILQQLGDEQEASGDLPQLQRTATSMLVILTYWLSYEYVLDPRSALEPENEERALLRGAAQILHMLLPHAQPDARNYLQQLLGAYQGAA